MIRTKRVCPHNDRTCQWGMSCPHTCATGEYDGTKRLIPDKAKDGDAAIRQRDEAFKLLERLDAALGQQRPWNIAEAHEIAVRVLTATGEILADFRTLIAKGK